MARASLDTDESHFDMPKGEETLTHTLCEKVEVHCNLTVEDEPTTIVDMAARTNEKAPGKFWISEDVKETPWESLGKMY